MILCPLCALPGRVGCRDREWGPVNPWHKGRQAQRVKRRGRTWAPAYVTHQRREQGDNQGWSLITEFLQCSLWIVYYYILCLRLDGLGGHGYITVLSMPTCFFFLIVISKKGIMPSWHFQCPTHSTKQNPVKYLFVLFCSLSYVIDLAWEIQSCVTFIILIVVFVLLYLISPQSVCTGFQFNLQHNLLKIRTDEWLTQ